MEFYKRKEFACKCNCGFDTIDYELAEVMDDVRRFFGKPVHINRGCSCVKHNNVVGGSSNSQHPLGKACDFYVEDVHADIVADYLETKYPNKYGIGRYNGRTHIDVRSNKARWDNR